jgi:hypothetical protein
LRSDIRVVLGGSFSVDHIGPEEYEALRGRIVENAPLINRLIGDEFLESPVSVDRRRLELLLRLTAEVDSDGSLELALRLRSLIDDGLIDYDRFADKDEALRTMQEEHRHMVERFLSRRMSVQQLIRDLRNDP